MIYPYLNDIQADRKNAVPVYLQIAHSFSRLIKEGIIKPGQKLPGSRLLAEKLKLNRNTILLAFDELLAEGWAEARPRSGLYVNKELPIVQPHPSVNPEKNSFEKAGFELSVNSFPEAPEVQHYPLQFNDGIPDPRLSPLNELGREYHRLLKKSAPLSLFSYSDAKGDPGLRKALSKDLGEHRGLKAGPEQLMISRGSIMAIYLIVQTLIKRGDAIVVGELSYITANICFEQAGARLLRIPVDEKGLNTHTLEKLLETETIRMLYVTSHHHHPTTVTLAPERRIHLYELAKKHRFVILEDDYDFDYHYENKPTLPIASVDTYGLVVYIGSYSKIIYPGIRIGFIVAPENVIGEMARFRRFLDRQGDHVQERALAGLIQDGSLQRYLRKSKKEYKKRKEYFCQQLKERFKPYLDFTEPEGGMAVWVKFREQYPLAVVAAACRARGLYLSDGKMYNPPGKNLNACRMGFATMDREEMAESCGILEEVLKEIESSKSGSK